MKYVFVVSILVALAGTANASNSFFYGTSFNDTMLVGRGYDGGALVHLACINNVWVYGQLVTGSSDAVYVYGYGGNDTMTIRDTNDLYNCGGYVKWLYRMDYNYSCPNTIYLSGGAGNDLMYGGQCAETFYGYDGDDRIYGGAGYDTVNAGMGNDCIGDTSLASLVCGDGYDGYTDGGAWKDCESRVKSCVGF